MGMQRLLPITPRGSGQGPFFKLPEAGIIKITDNGQVSFQGLADSPCWFVGGNTVQEETNALGIGIVPFGSGGRGVDAQFTKFSALAGKDVYYASRTNTAGGFSALNSE